MVDYDGQDALITYLNGLAWTALTEPTYYQYQDQKNTEIPNTVIVHLTSVIPERKGELEYALHHQMTVQYNHSTKVNGWANLKYILTNLWSLVDDNTWYSIGEEIGVEFTELRKTFFISVSYSEILTM